MAKTQPNAKGQTFEVSFNKVFKTNYGLRFKFFPSDNKDVQAFVNDEMLGFFFKPMLQIHHLNVGCAIFVINEKPQDGDLPICPTDNEYDLDEIYQMIEKGECR